MGANNFVYIFYRGLATSQDVQDISFEDTLPGLATAKDQEDFAAKLLFTEGLALRKPGSSKTKFDRLKLWFCLH